MPNRVPPFVKFGLSMSLMRLQSHFLSRTTRGPLTGAWLTALAALSIPVFVAIPAAAQEVTSRPVVQPLPSEDVQRLNRALLQLAKRPRSMATLLEAGDAAVAVGDLDAAIGFFGRAREIEPDNPKVSFGLASVYLRSGRPVSALSLLRSAPGAASQDAAVLLEEALALDMVGEQAAAQAVYTRLIAREPGETSVLRAEAQRRLALSYAISGNSEGFESTLRPLVERRDFAAFRTRAFGLAIMGEQARAAAIVDAVMPRDLGDRISPYLEFMPRLTPSQQAAAANLGVFPRAADIGRDSVEVAAYRNGPATGPAAGSIAGPTPRIAAVPVGDAGDQLEPAGEPLGNRQAAPSASTPAAVIAPARVAGADAPSPGPVSVAIPASVALPEPEPAVPARTPPTITPVPTLSGPTEIAVRVAEVNSPSTLRSQPLPQPQPQPQPQPARVADAFGDLLSEPAPRAGTTMGKPPGAVDIARIEIPREAPPAAAKPASVAKPEPAKPVHPRRIWVQLATGRDLKALAFDWRRLERKAPDQLGDMKAHTSPWGQANRLLVGPVSSDAQARKLVTALKEKGIDTFSYTSPEGTEIQPLNR